jgi:hypothetical protein
LLLLFNDTQSSRDKVAGLIRQRATAKLRIFSKKLKSFCPNNPKTKIKQHTTLENENERRTIPTLLFRYGNEKGH